MYYCFGCGAGGNVFTFLMEYENYTFPEAVKTLADRCGVELPEVEYSEEARRQADLKSRLLEIQKKAARYYYYELRQKKGRAAYEYLKGQMCIRDRHGTWFQRQDRVPENRKKDRRPARLSWRLVWLRMKKYSLQTMRSIMRLRNTVL